MAKKQEWRVGMDIYKLKQISDDLMKVVFTEMEYRGGAVDIPKERPAGFKKVDWEELVCGIGDLSREVEKEINKRDKELLLK
jgi:hypothetical protein